MFLLGICKERFGKLLSLVSLIVIVTIAQECCAKERTAASAISVVVEGSKTSGVHGPPASQPTVHFNPTGRRHHNLNSGGKGTMNSGAGTVNSGSGKGPGSGGKNDPNAGGEGGPGGPGGMPGMPGQPGRRV